MPEVSPGLNKAVIEFYRDELRLRYQVKNVRRFDEFSVIDDATVDALRDYFLGHIYPSPSERAKLDDAFDHLGALLRSPKRLGPLVTTVLGSMWRLGRRLPAAASAGKATFDAYIETRRLERYMLERAAQIKLTAAQAKDRSKMLSLITGIPEKHVFRLIHDIINLFHSLTQIDLLRTSAEIMAHVHGIMEARPALYGKSDRDGLALGLDVLRGGLALFERMDNRVFPQLIHGIERIEYDWFDRVRAEAGAPRRKGA